MAAMRRVKPTLDLISQMSDSKWGLKDTLSLKDTPNMHPSFCALISLPAMEIDSGEVVTVAEWATSCVFSVFNARPIRLAVSAKSFDWAVSARRASETRR